MQVNVPLPLNDINEEIHNMVMIGYPSEAHHSILVFESYDRKSILFKDSNRLTIEVALNLMIKNKEEQEYINIAFDDYYNPEEKETIASQILKGKESIGEYIVAKLSK